MKIPSSNLGRTCCIQKFIWHSEQFLYTTCSPHALQKEELLTKIYLYLAYWLFFLFSYFRPEEVHNIVSGKLALKYSGTDIEAMKLVAQASKKRSLADFQTTVGKYSKELKGDKIVARHLDTLYQTMLEQNLCRIIEPYSRVQVILTLWKSSIFENRFLFWINHS